jgi:hypothetical protein
MKQWCKNHPHIEARSFCHNCGEYYCHECLNEGNQYYYCAKPRCQRARHDDLTPLIVREKPRTKPWSDQLPEHLRPSQKILVELEQFRTREHLPTETILQMICTSPWAVRRTQEITFAQLRLQNPTLTEPEIWEALILSRLKTKMNFPAPWDPPPDGLVEQMEATRDRVTQMHSWEDVEKFILDMDAPAFAAMSDPAQQAIHKILEKDPPSQWREDAVFFAKVSPENVKLAYQDKPVEFFLGFVLSLAPLACVGAAIVSLISGEFGLALIFIVMAVITGTYWYKKHLRQMNSHP